jgi:Zn-dependent peptidase ImmA (M78 family)
MKKNKLTTVDILGTTYTIYETTTDHDELLKKFDGYITPTTKTIMLNKNAAPLYKKYILKHELAHAFLYESGLDDQSWGSNEEIVDWIALQLEKISKTFKSVAKII